MSDETVAGNGSEPTAAGEPAPTPATPTGPTPAAPVSAGDGTTGAGDAPVPGDPVRRDLAAVEDAMARARAGVPNPDGGPRVPDDDEVAGLEQAHDALRTTLDRVERGG
ncbi:hypothetical protein ACXR2U_09850 [Jatrophihabitans sp. YIM 134969]